MKDKRKTNKLINNLFETGLVTAEERDLYSETLKEIKDEDSLAILIEDLETKAISRGSIQEDIARLVRIIMFGAINKNITEREIFSMFEKPERFKITAIDIYQFKYKDMPYYHPIITIEYQDNKYSFGFNSQKLALSYSVNDGPVLWFNFAKESEEHIDEELAYMITDILGIDVFA
jgi:hypothetical protein